MERESIGKTMLVVLGAVLSGGCVHYERYPESWEPVRVSAATDCAAVATTYANEGDNSNSQRVSLAQWLQPRQYKSQAERAAYESDLSKAQTVELQLSANVLTFVASGENIHREWSFDSNKHEFECRRGVARIHSGLEVTSDIVLAVSKGSDDLYRVGDHLVVRSHGGGAGLVLMVVPVAFVGTSWGRFDVIRSPGTGK